jgi:predicted metal-binding membrane protein
VDHASAGSESRFSWRLDRTQIVLLILLLVAAALAWVWTILEARGMEGMGGGMSGMPAGDGVGSAETRGAASGMGGMEEMDHRLGVTLESPAAAFAAFLPMWTVMMAAMMFPSAQPVAFTVASVYQRRAQRRLPLPLLLLGIGYLAAWAAIGIPALAANLVLLELAERNAFLYDLAPYAGAAVLVGAGLYQFSEWKVRCLSHCRTPFDFLMAHWREGRSGALRMGLSHGWYCIGCCWGLMAVLFVVGVMNLAWMAVLTLAILLERIGPWPRVTRYGTAGVLCTAGVLMAINPAHVPGF